MKFSPDRRPTDAGDARRARHVRARHTIDRPTPARAPTNPRHSPLPNRIAPQLATLVARAPEGPEWFHEIKYDGYRVLCRVAHGQARLYSRNGIDLTAKMAAVARAVERAHELESGWLDGEVVALQADGRSSFDRLQAALREGRDTDMYYYLFDLPYCNGTDLTEQPLRERKIRLAAMLRRQSEGGPLRYSDHVQGDGPTFHQQACEFGLEGIVSKRADAPYRAARGPDWQKVKCRLRQEFVIGGYSEPNGARSGLGALLVGVYADGALRYSGRVGTGFDAATLHALERRLAALQRETPAFAAPLPAEARRGAVHWVEPDTVVDVEFTSWTHDGRVRQGSFRGVREDKAARDVVRERPATPGAVTRRLKAARKSALVPTMRHADKVLYVEDGITKQELATYYKAVAEPLLSDIRARPLTLVRCPDGYDKQCFFQKHSAASMPASIHRIPIAERAATKQYIAVDSLEGLWALAQLGALELHVWGARADRSDCPDRLVFDLDPDATVPWGDVIEAALRVRARLDDLGLASFARTTGGKGLHVVAPLTRRHDWAMVKTFAKALAEDLVRGDPTKYTARLPLAARRGKIFIDYLRNARGATAIANYSPRARPHAPVAVPLAWDEVTPALRPAMYTVRSVPARLTQTKRDPWAGFDTTRQSLTRRARRALGLD